MSSRAAHAVAHLTAGQARRLLLHAQALTVDPRGPAHAAAINQLIERMGFVQVDSINVVERAHHLILASRLDGYRRETLAHLLEQERSLFEHWTHDASVIPTKWFAHWRPRFERYRRRDPEHPWWKARMGPDPPSVLAEVLERVERGGAIMSRDFEKPRTDPSGITDKWWQWKPHKCALEHLWRCGDLAVARRVNFQKVYDLTSRVLPEHCARPAPAPPEHIDWACRSALDRLGVATPREIARFWHAVDLADIRTWCDAALTRGEVETVEVRPADGGEPWRALAPADWPQRLAKAPAAPRRARILSPFDPIVRDRSRALRLFDLDFRFEAFVPAPRRRFGYYVMPVLDGDRLVARIDPKFDRDRGVLKVRCLWWEAGMRLSDALESRVQAAVARLARFIGAETWTIGRSRINRGGRAHQGG